ncbi:hypothetical protein ACIGW3_01465 [Streptomyces sp. NPDC053499]|uniref:hypothetical protein n=1 Tax=Streptomyces sp. NPDC053499 TaxID=3365707 RepID=UPI0037CFC383
MDGLKILPPGHHDDGRAPDHVGPGSSDDKGSVGRAIECTSVALTALNWLVNILAYALFIFLIWHEPAAPVRGGTP